MKRLASLFLVAWSSSAYADVRPPCTASMPINTRCKIAVNDVWPTQLTYGAIEVRIRAEKIRSMDADELDEYLRDHRAPLVVGPDDKLYLTDRHHLSLALAEALGPQAYLEATILQNWRHQDIDSFWSAMDSNQLLWLYDEEGNGPLDCSRLPDSVFDLQDDPFRSLAWGVSEEGGYDETDVPHADFMWANYLRRFVDRDLIERDFDAAVTKGIEAAHRPEAANLPGFRG